MNFLKLFLLNFCPINVFRPNLESQLPHIYKYSMIDVFNDVIERDPEKYNRQFQEIFEVPEEDDVYIFSYHSFVRYYDKHVKDLDLPYSTINKINKYGCVYRTNKPVYRALGLFVGDGVIEHYYLYHTLIIIFVTNSSCLMSSLQIFKNKYLQFLFTSLAILVPHLLVMYMMDAKYLALAMVALLGLVFGTYLAKRPWKNTEPETLRNGFVHYVNFARGSLLIAIIIVILGVDNINFNQFMRKTFYDGFSAMDIGAGFFVTQTGASIALSRRKKNVAVILKKNIIILLIAVLRTISVEVLKYNVDVREYGKHWNFFYTLVFARIGVDLINTYCHKYVVYAMPFFITIVYEVILVLTQAVDKMPDLDRSNFFYANREGILSIPNSISGSLIVLLVTKVAIHYYRDGKIFKAFIAYMFTSLSCFLLASVLYFAKLKSCRSLNNLRYLLYVMFLYNLAMGSVVIFEMIYPRYRENQVAYALGKYPLMVYLIANIGTGMTNMIFKPYLLPLPYFILILTVYTYICMLSGLLFQKLGLKSMSAWL